MLIVSRQLSLLAIFAMSVLTSCSRALLYHPTRLSQAEAQALENKPGWKGVRLAHDEGSNFGLVSPAREGGAPWLLFFGGNGMKIESSQQVLSDIRGEQAYGLCVFAYRGYDTSDGQPAQEALLSDAVAAYDWLQREHGVAPEQLVTVGQSLGTGIAVHVSVTLARRGAAPAGTVLLSPYTSMAQVFDDHLPLIPIGWAVSEDYRTEELTEELTPPILMIHGDRDEVIDVRHGRELAKLLEGRAELKVIPGAHHNDLWDRAEVLDAVQGFVGRLRRTKPPG